MVIGQNCRIDFLSPTVPGTVADVNVARESDLDFPDGSCVIQDCGFQGFEVSSSETDVEILQPTKKRKNQARSLLDKAINKIISSSRVYIEHVIGSSKRWRCVHDICRLRGEGVHDLLMEICCGLHNLKNRICPWANVPEPGRGF